MTNIQIDPLVKEQAMHYPGLLPSPLFTWRGRDVFPVWGSEGDDDPQNDPDSEPEEDEDDDAGEGGTGTDEKPVSRAEFDKLRNQLSQADKRRDEAEKKLKEIDDSKKDELTKATERAEELEKQVEQGRGEISELRLQNAFLLADSGITWHDSGDALALAERKGYLEGVVDEDGKVDTKALATKLKEMAKKHPYLVKTGTDSGKGEETPPASGQKVGTKSQKNSKDTGKIPSRYDKYLT